MQIKKAEVFMRSTDRWGAVVRYFQYGNTISDIIVPWLEKTRR